MNRGLFNRRLRRLTQISDIICADLRNLRLSSVFPEFQIQIRPLPEAWALALRRVL